MSPAEQTAIGNTWLRQEFGLPGLSLSHESYIGSRSILRGVEQNGAIEIFHRTYAVGPDPLKHIEFALKYDGPNLRLLHSVFRALRDEHVEAFIAARPTGLYTRKIGFLYEFLTGRRLPLAGVTIGGGYVPLMDESAYITAAPVRVPRWRIEDNLLGPATFSPIVRRTPAITAALARDWRADLQAIVEAAPPELVYRALTYLYLKETASSFLIEHEEPGPQRTERFVAALRGAGQVTAGDSLSTARLVALQNTILQPVREEPSTGYRQTQNYVAENAGPRQQLVHYVSPPAGFVPSLMLGLAESSARLGSVPPGVHAAVVAFQFVFIHPFDDGNGRIHRFLIHDILTRRDFVRNNLLLPVSAAMLKDLRSYNRALESFSVPLLAQLRYEMGADGRITITNPEEVEPAWRYPDLTAQVEYLHSVIGETIAAIPSEFDYLRNYDRARQAIGAIVNLPDRRLSSLIDWLHDGHGRLSNNKRRQFSELLPREVELIENAYCEAFGLGGIREP